MSDLKTLKEELARSKGYYHRHEIIRGLTALAQATKLAATLPLAGHERTLAALQTVELVQLFNRVDAVRSALPEGLVYEKGKEKALFAVLVGLLKTLRDAVLAQAAPTEESILDRKLKIDRALLKAGRLLEAGRVVEAEAAFNQAAALYVDEHALFYVIGKRLFEAKQPGKALEWIKKSFKTDPDNRQAFELAAQCCEAVNDPAPGLDLLDEAMTRLGVWLDGLVAKAKLLVQAGRRDEAAQAAQAALDLDPTDARVEKLLAALS